MHRGGRLVVGALAALAVVVALLAFDRDRRAGTSSSSADEQPSVTASPSPTATASSPPAPEGPPLLLPNMRSLNAFDLQIERTADGRLLRFAAALANLGPGPLLLLLRIGLVELIEQPLAMGLAIARRHPEGPSARVRRGVPLRPGPPFHSEMSESFPGGHGHLLVEGS